jgi:hypothetical protein
MNRTLALLAAVAFGVSSGVAFAAGDCGGSYHVGTSKTTVASVDGQTSAPSTPVQKPSGG